MKRKMYIFLVFFMLINSTVLFSATDYDITTDTVDTTQVPIQNFNLENLELKNDKPCDCQDSNIYERPYLFFDTCSPQKGLLRNTGLFVGGAVGIMVFLYLLPEDVTSWDRRNFTFKSIFDKWKYNITQGPKFDNDIKFWNYVAHPYWGGVYYMSTRSLGYNPLYSFLYAATMSTFLWEYGFEALAEVPSIQDLILTPVIGSIFGELFYLAKREIIKNDYHLLNSKFLGHFVNFLVDPSNELSNLFFKEKVENNNFIVNFTFQPNFVYSGKSGYNILLVYRF